MKGVLFIGNFLSKKRGTLNPSEKIINELTKDGFSIIKCSSIENKLLRICDIFFNTLFKNYSLIHIDVFSGNAFTFSFLSVIIANARNKKIILTLHGGKLPVFFLKNQKLVNMVFKRAMIIQTPSLYLKNYFEQNDYKISYLPNPIEIKLFPYKRDEVQQYSLLWVRAFNSIYNPEVAIIILHRLIQNFPYASLTMVGPDKGELSKVKSLAKEFGLTDKVIFTGPIKNHQLHKYYQTHQVYINTTSYESFGVAVMEAAACGIPIVSNSVGEIPYLWENEKDILLVNDNNLKEYLNHIINIFENDSFSNKISTNARRKAVTFDWENVKNIWLKILN